MKEHIAQACLSGDLDEDVCKVILIRQAIQAEHEASNIYDSAAEYFEEIGFERGKDIMMDISDEEEVHVGEFTELLTEVNKDYGKNISLGMKESQHI